MTREPLPDGWKGVMRDRLTRVGMFLQHRAGLPPLFIVKVSRRVSVPHAAVGFGRINMYTYFGREYVLGLHLLLDGAPRSEEVECLFNPRKQKDCELLSALTISETVDVAFVVDNTKMTFLGTKRFPWPEQKRTRVRTLLVTPLAPRSRTQKPSWTTVVEAHRMSLDAHRAAFPSGDEPLPLSLPSKIQTQVASTPPIPSPPAELKPISRQKMKVIVSSPLLLDRYLLRSQEVRVIDARTLDKYLWMQSAWLMADALRHGITFPILSLPKRALYIELEHPQQLYHQEVAAFSFALHEQCWVFAVLDSNGQAIWSIHYEQHTWALPRAYHCPEQQCQTVADGEGMSYLLCELCQQRINHFPPWLVVALRMIHGDFQAEITLQEPEVIVSSGHYTVREGQDGPTSTIQTHHTFRVIRSFDASVSSPTNYETRGSWMQGRPLAIGADEFNPNAILYVQIQPDAYDRKYVHDRYINAKGTVHHIEPGPRLQPMTVAAFQQLGRWQRLTRVTASRYEEQARMKE